MPASDDRFFKHLINIPLILPDISSKTELQVSEDLLYESLDILRIKCLVLRNKVDLECHTLLSLADLVAAVDIEELYVTDLLACLPDLRLPQLTSSSTTIARSRVTVSYSEIGL